MNDKTSSAWVERRSATNTPPAKKIDFELKGDTKCQWGSKECNRCVNNVRTNFNSIETHFKGERASKIHVSSYAYTPKSKDYLLHRISYYRKEHIQGVGRIAGLGNEEYLVFTHSTNSPAAGKSGALAVVRMGANQGSRGFEWGDLQKRTGADQNIHNRTVARTYSDSNHPGGLATLGHYVFVADWCQDQTRGSHAWCNNSSQFSFEVYDVSNAHKNGGRLNSNPPIRIIDRSVYRAGDSKRDKSTASVAATRLTSGKYLVGMGRSGGSNYEYYLSNTTYLSSQTKWLSTGYPENIAKHGEGAAMVNECGSGDIYLIQIENSGSHIEGNTKDQLHLFQLQKNSNSGSIKHHYIDSRTFKCSEGTPWCNFDKGGGIYISPTGNMYLYATDAHQSNDTKRFRMVEFGNSRETGYSPGLGTKKSCESSSIGTCSKHSAQCKVVHTLTGMTTDVCHWPTKNAAAACTAAKGIWTTPVSKYAKNHPDAVPTGSNGICASEVKNLRNVQPAVDIAALTATLGHMQTGQFYKSEAQTTKVQTRQVQTSQIQTSQMQVAEASAPGKGSLAAPSSLTISEVSNNALKLNWMDNATTEYGISVQRGMPVEARGGINYQWKTVFHVEEGIDSRVKGTGLRSDSDDGLSPNTEYCYRVRAFYMRQVSAYSEPVCVRTGS